MLQPPSKPQPPFDPKIKPKAPTKKRVEKSQLQTVPQILCLLSAFPLILAAKFDSTFNFGTKIVP